MLIINNSETITDAKDTQSYKICILSTGHRSFDHRIYYKEAYSLAERYTPIVLIARKEKIPLKKNTNIHHIFLKNDGDFLSRFLSIPKAIYLITKIKPQVCHIQDYELIFALPFIRIFLGCKVIYDIHELYPAMAKESKKIPRALRLLIGKLVFFSEKRLSLLAHYIITSDNNISKHLCNSSVKIATIYNYPRLSLFCPDERKVSELKSRFKSKTLIIYAGGMHESKGIFQIIRAIKILISHIPNLKLLLVGEIQGVEEQVVNEIEKLNIREYVELIGMVPHIDVVNYICICKVGLICNLPTEKWQNNIPVKLFEYMACGIPVLGSNLPPIESYVNKARCGYVFDSTSIEALANGVINILKDKKEWKRMSDAGKLAVRHLWNWSLMEDRLLSVYTELLGS